MTNNELRAEFLETLYNKTQRSGIWKIRGDNSFEANIGNLNIHLDKGTLGDRVAYSIWVFSSTEGLVDHMYDNTLEKLQPKLEGFKSYEQVIRTMYAFARSDVAANKLASALEILKSSEPSEG